MMRKSKTIWKAAAGCLFASCLLIGGSIPAWASAQEAEAPVAGMAVSLNNYYASSLTPESDIAAYMRYTVMKSAKGLENQPSEPESSEGEPDSQNLDEPESITASAYENVAVAQVEGYVNVRQKPDAQSGIVGKIYNNCAATILNTVSAADGKWYYIQSGNVTGYIKAEFFVTGEAAETLAKQVGVMMATINTNTVRVRSVPSLGDDAQVLTTLPMGEQYVVLEEMADWVKVAVDDDIIGYVYKACVDLRVDFKTAITLQEEADRAADQARRDQEAQDALDALNNAGLPNTSTAVPTTAAPTAPPTAAPTTTAPTAAPTAPPTTTAPVTAPPTTAPTTTAPTTAPTTSGSDGEIGGQFAAVRRALVANARKYLGCPYVYGGNSLTNGTDCSYFTMALYSMVGISIPRTSAMQSTVGRTIPYSQVQPGDLLFYDGGTGQINHVAMYVGDGMIIHAANVQLGVCMSSMYYRTPVKAITLLD